MDCFASDSVIYFTSVKRTLFDPLTISARSAASCWLQGLEIEEIINMRKITRRSFLTAAVACGAAAALSACGGSSSASSAAASSTVASASVAAASNGEKFTVGICQLVQHAALDAATQGFEDALTASFGENVTFDFQNAQGDSATCATIANGILRLCRIDPHILDDLVTEEEILQMVGEGEEKGVIEETERDMITNILDFKDTTAGETMTHRTDIIALEDTDTISQVVEASVENGCSRMPVYHEDIDTVVGICYIKDLLPYVGRPVPEFIKITDLMRPAYFVPETKKWSQLFTEMTERKVQIAIVLDEYGGTAGLITLEDLVEDIVGNIQDEYDHEEEEIHRMSETEFTVDGAASIDEVADMAGVDLPEGDYDTIAGLVTERLGRLPKAGEHPQVKEAGLTITVLEVEEQRIARLLLVKDAQEEPTGKEESERK